MDPHNCHRTPEVNEQANRVVLQLKGAQVVTAKGQTSVGKNTSMLLFKPQFRMSNAGTKPACPALVGEMSVGGGQADIKFDVRAASNPPTSTLMKCLHAICSVKRSTIFFVFGQKGSDCVWQREMMLRIEV